MLEQVGAEGDVPGEVVAFGEVDLQSEVAVGEWADDEFGFQAGKACAAIGPGVELVPELDELGAIGVGEGWEIMAAGDLDQGVAVQIIEDGPGDGAAADAVHGGAVGAAPGIGDIGPIGGEAAQGAEALEASDDAGAPIDQGAEDIEQDGAGLVHGLAADQEQDNDQSDGDGLEGDAQAHEFVLAARIGAGGHADGAEQEHDDDGEHIKAEQDEEKIMHRVDIGVALGCR